MAIPCNDGSPSSRMENMAAVATTSPERRSSTTTSMALQASRNDCTRVPDRLDRHRRIGFDRILNGREGVEVRVAELAERISRLVHGEHVKRT